MRIGSQKQGRIEHVRSHTPQQSLRYDLGVPAPVAHGPNQNGIKHVRYLSELGCPPKETSAKTG